jgi:hypothetical protein
MTPGKTWARRNIGAKALMAWLGSPEGVKSFVAGTETNSLEAGSWVALGSARSDRASTGKGVAERGQNAVAESRFCADGLKSGQ